MSLVTLTFGTKRVISASPHAFVSTPEERINQMIGAQDHAIGSAVVKKTCKFYGEEEVYVVAEVSEGLISEGMKVFSDEKEFELVGVESKYGKNARKGMTIGLTVKGIAESALQKGMILKFEKN